MTGRASVVAASAAPGARFGPPAVLAEDVCPYRASRSRSPRTVARSWRTTATAQGVQVYERAPGAVAFAAAGDVRATGTWGARPAVALATDGSAVVAWRDGEAVDAVARNGTGAWGVGGPICRARRRDDSLSLESSFGVYATEGPPVDYDDGRARAVAGSGGAAVVGWLEPSTPEGGPARAWAASAAAGIFAPGGRARQPAPRRRRRACRRPAPAVPRPSWTDNGAFSRGTLPIGDGRLHLACARPAARTDSPAGGPGDGAAAVAPVPRAARGARALRRRVRPPRRDRRPAR